MTKKATLESLLARKQNSTAKQFIEATVSVAGEELTFTIQRLPLATVLRIMDDMTADEGLSAQYDRFVRIIYQACPVMQDKKLQQAYECAEPYDVVAAVLCDDVGAITKLGELVLAQYGLGTDAPVNDLKN